MSTTVRPTRIHNTYCRTRNNAITTGSDEDFGYNTGVFKHGYIGGLRYDPSSYTARAYYLTFFEFAYTLPAGNKLSRAVLHMYPDQTTTQSSGITIQALKYAPINFNNFNYTAWFNQYFGKQEVNGSQLSFGTVAAKFYELDITSVIVNQTPSNCVFAVWLNPEQLASANSVKVFAPIVTNNLASGQNIYITLDFEAVIPQAPSLVSPSGEILEKGLTKFSWIYNSQYDTGQTGFDFEYKRNTDSTWTSVHIDSIVTSYTVDTSNWSNGLIDWRVRCYNASGRSGPYASPSSFELIGAPSAPTIMNITNDAIPVLTWSADMTEAATIQMIVSQNNVDIWDSGEIAIVNSRDIRVDAILANGTYSAKIRIGSIYGQYSQWTGRAFTISATAPSAPSISVAIENENAVITTSAEGIKFLYRNNIPIAMFTGTEYVDTTLQPNRDYTYFIRLYDGSYADSASRTVQVQFSGWKLSLLSDTENAIKLDRNTSEPYTKITRNFENEVSYNQYIGRGYPVKEAGNAKSESFTGAFYLTVDEFENLVEIINANGTYLLRGDTQVMYCDAKIEGATNSHLNRGYDVTIECTRIYYDELVHFNDI